MAWEIWDDWVNFQSTPTPSISANFGTIVTILLIRTSRKGRKDDSSVKNQRVAIGVAVPPVPSLPRSVAMISPLRYRLEQLMKKARVVPCLAMMAAGLLAGSAAAQDAPGRAVAGDGSSGFDRFGNRNFQLRSDIGDGVGYSNGYQTFGIFQPLMLEPDQSLFFVNPRGVVTYEGDFIGNLGGGFRWLNPETERILGIGGWYDHDVNGANDYDQWGISFESLGNLFDFRANAYLPTETSAKTLQQNLTGSVFFVGNNIGLGRFSVYQSHFGGGDFEVGGALIPGFSDAGIRAYAGGYYLQGDDTIGAGYGVKARIEALITQDFQVNVGWTNDTFFETNLTASVTWYLGTGESPRWFQRMPQTTRLYQQMERNYRNMVLTHDVTDFVLALRAGGTGGSGGAVGTPIEVFHVNNLAAGGGDGSFERPLNQLPSTTASSVDIILVDRGDGTTARMNGGIVLNDWQRLLGDGRQHTFTSTQGTFVLPGFSPGAFPAITNLGGSAVTLASHNEVSAFRIPGAGAAGITGGDVTDFNLNNLTITDAGTQGIVIANASGTGVINNVTVTDAGQNGIDIASTGTSLLDLTTRNVNVTGSGASGFNGVGFNISTFDSATVNLDSRGDTFSSNAEDGVLLSSAGNSTIDALLRNAIIRTNGGNGVTVRGDNASTITAVLNTADISSNRNNGVQMRLTGTSLGDLSVLNSTIQGNTNDGVRLDIEDASVANVTLTNNTITGGSVGLTFLLVGNTLTQPFTITNSTAVGGPDLSEFSMTLNGTNVFDTSNPPTGTPFAPANGTEITAGLNTVNGTTNPPAWLVADNSTTLDMTFDTLIPTTSFQWNIDVDPNPLVNGTINGNQLIGTQVTATYSDGQILTGALVAVAGQPNASTFVATSGLGGGSGVHILGSGTGELRSATISNNSITRSGSHGVSIDMQDSSIVGVGGVRIANNTITDNGSATGSTGDGINVLVRNSAQIGSGLLNINTNTITDNTGNGVGLRAEDSALLNAVLRGNTITDNALAGVSVSSAAAPTVNVSLLEQNIIRTNGTDGVVFDMIGTNTTTVISNAIISDNGGFGIAATATGGNFDLTVGGVLATDRVLLDNNVGAGIAFTLLDTATGTTFIANNRITNTTALAGSTTYTGQAIDIRLTDSGIPVTATSSLVNSLIISNELGSETTPADGNAGAGLVVFANNNTTIDALIVANNLVANNGAQGVVFDRRNTATVDGVILSDNRIINNPGVGVEINVRNANNDVNNYLLARNEILNSGGVGVLLNVEADGQLQADLEENTITGSGSHGIRLIETINSENDTRFITGTWERNTISNNAGAGIFDAFANGINGAAVSNLNIGTLGNGNIIENNQGTGIVIGSPGTGTITANSISGNGAGVAGTTGVGGIDLNIIRSTTNLINVWSISSNTIVANIGDGIEVLNDQPRFDPATPGLQVTISDNTIRRNTGRGIDILNRMAPGEFRSDLAISVAGNRIQENFLEGVYLVNTSSSSQNQTASAAATLAADGATNVRPRVDFSFADNLVTGNGTNSVFNSTGLIVRVGTSDGGYGFTNPGGFFSSGRGGVGAEVTNNTFGGNFGNDIYYDSFTSTTDPGQSTGTWSDIAFAPTFYQGDPLARLDLIQTGNIFDSTAVNNAGAFYSNAEAVFKSRDVAQTDPGPFQSNTRERNAQRLGFRGTLPPGTPGGASNLFLYAGLGQSTFRIQTGFDATAGFITDDAPYNNIFDAFGVFSPTGAGFRPEAMPYGWTEF